MAGSWVSPEKTQMTPGTRIRTFSTSLLIDKILSPLIDLYQKLRMRDQWPIL